MQRIIILGGGVGGTLVANLLARKLHAEIDRGRVAVTVVDATGDHVYQPGFMYIAMGAEREQSLRRAERGLLDRRVELVVGDIVRIDESRRAVELGEGTRLIYDYLVVATGSRILPEAIAHFNEEAHHFYTPDAARRLRRALDAFTGGRIVIGIAGMPYKCPPAPLEVAFLIDSELRDRHLRDRTEMHFCSPIGRVFTIESVSEMATPVFVEKGIEVHTFFNVDEIDPEQKLVRSLEGEELPYDLLILVPPHKGAQCVIDSGLAPSSGWLPTDRETLQVKTAPDAPDGTKAPRFPNVYALGDATDLPLSKAGSTAHFEAPVVAERIAAQVRGVEPEATAGTYTGKVMCFFEIGGGKATVLQFDYNHPPRPPKPNRFWHLGKIVFNKTYWHTVPKGRV
ncbi:MAG: FAD/NAD(P)-binding oxidoreductase [Chloroflexi bacterium]|nr:FAD/NAD(P)-binding oxidoreductase [Chloroflexota bacterium]